MTDSTEGLRQIKKRMTRGLIAETAMQLTLEKGLENVTSEEIAHFAFVSPRTVSNYFSCKEEAVIAASGTLPQLVEQYALSPSEDPPWQTLRALVTNFFATSTHEQLGRARERLQLIENHPMLLKFQMASHGQAERDLRALIAERTGTEVGIDLYPSLVASAAVTALRTGFSVWATSDATDEHLTELLAGAFNLLENGLGLVAGTVVTDEGQSASSVRETVTQSAGNTPTSADRQAAAAVVAEAVTFAREAQADLAAFAVIETGAAVATAAEKAADAAETARMDRASAAADAAAVVAGNAAEAAVATQLRADASAVKMSEAAARAVAIINADTTPGNDRETVLRAMQVAATADALAASTAQDTAATAAGVAIAVSAAAADVAFSVSALDQAIADEVARVAVALQTTATTIARQIAADTYIRDTDVALVARGAAAAVSDSGLDGETTSEPRPATNREALDVAGASVAAPASTADSRTLSAVQAQPAGLGTRP